jgi:DNA-binding transcriptional LysR family regulator
MRRGHPLAERALTLEDYCAADHLLVSFSGRPHGLMDQALAALGRRRRIVLTVNQFFTAGRVVTQSDLLTVLPRASCRHRLRGPDVVTRELPFAMEPVSVQMLWPLRLDGDAAQRWLRERVVQRGDGGRVAWGGPDQASTAAMASAVRSTLPVFSPATQMRPERIRYTACCSRSWSTWAALRPV